VQACLAADDGDVLPQPNTLLTHREAWVKYDIWAKFQTSRPNLGHLVAHPSDELLEVLDGRVMAPG
jgi:hypothetical protein